MAIVNHATAVIDGTPQVTFQDRTFVGAQYAVANASGAAGATVSTVVTFNEPIPVPAAVFVNPRQSAVWWVDTFTTFGFTVHMAPPNITAEASIAAGTFDVFLVTP
jgi:hypothetical protein